MKKYKSQADYEKHLDYMRLYMRGWRARNLDKKREQDRQAAARRPRDIRFWCRYQYNKAVEKRIVTRPGRCSRCGSTGRITAHHADYLRPFKFVGLCYRCHGIESRTVRISV